VKGCEGISQGQIGTGMEFGENSKTLNSGELGKKNTG